MKRPVLSIALLLATFLAASDTHAQITGSDVKGIGDFGESGSRRMAVNFSNDTIKYYNDINSSTTASGSHYTITGTINLSSIDLSSFTTDLASATIVGSDDAEGVFTFDNITAAGKLQSPDHGLYGFLNSASEAFRGTLTGTDMTISIVEQGAAAYGVAFRNGADWQDITANSDAAVDISLGNITVNATNTGGNSATGFVAGTLQSGQVSMASLTANSNESAIGAELTGITGGSFTISNSVHAYSNGTAVDGVGAIGLRINDTITAGTLQANEIFARNVGKGWASGIEINNGAEGGAIIADKIEAVATEGGANGLIVGQMATFGDPTSITGGVLNSNVTIGSITAKTGSDTINGTDAYGILVYDEIIGGTITINGDIHAESQSSDKGVGTAAGIGVNGQVAGDVTVKGDIIASSAHNAAGFASVFGGLASGKTLQLGNISATSTGNTFTGLTPSTAVGVRFSDHVAGAVNTGDITVNSTGLAYGVHVSNTNNTPSGAGIAQGTFGKIDVSSTRVSPTDHEEPTAAGIWTAGNSTFTLTKDVLARAAKGAESAETYAYGVVVENADADITVANDLTILATGANTNTGIAANNLNLALANAHLTTNSINANGDLDVGGKGTANLGILHVTGNTNIDGVAVTIDAAQSDLVGNNSLTNGGSLKIGNFASGTDLSHLGNWNNADGIIGGTFTNYTVNAQNNLEAVQAETANMTEGFLAAFGMHSRSTVWRAVRDQMISGSSRYQARQYVHYGQGYYGQESYEQIESVPFDTTPYDPCAPAAVPPMLSTGNISPNTAWANYIGRSDRYRSVFNGQDWETSVEGMQVGTDLFRTKYAQLGLIFGAENGKSVNGGDRVDAEDIYLGVYAAVVLQGGADIRGVFGYGWQDYDLNRWSDSLYTSSFKGNTIEGNLEIGKRLTSGPWSIRPVLGLDVISNEIDGAVETGSGTDAVQYGNATMTQLFVRAGTDLRYKVRNVTFNSGVYYAYDVNGGDDLETQVTSLDGIYASQLRGTQLGRSLLLFNVGGSLQLTRNLALMGGYQGESVFDRDDVVQSTGYIGGSWKW